MKKLFVSALVLVAGLFLIYLSSHSVGIKVGQPVPDWSLVNQKGNREKLSDYRGQVVLINFWATWCPPCVFEMPSLQRLYHQFEGKNFKVLAVAVDEGGWGAIGAFLKRVPVEFPLFWDQTGAVADLYGVSRLPESYLIDPQGLVIKRFSGPVEWDSPETVRLIEQLTEPLRN